MTLKFISWNIDSLNAALTSDSNRAIMTRNVLKSIIDIDPMVIAIQETKLPRTGPTKKHLNILEKYFPDYKLAWNVSKEPARKSYAGTMCLYKNHLKYKIAYTEIYASVTMDAECRILSLEFEELDITQAYTRYAGAKLVRSAQPQVW